MIYYIQERKGDKQMNVRKFHSGDIVKHFKREFLSEKEATITKMYEYRILSTNCVHTETGEKLVVYQALYGEQKVYARPYESFFSKVDHNKYPNIKQKYRFEKIEVEENI